MIWDESRWLFKVATVFPKIVFDVRHSETGDSLAEATIAPKSKVAALLLDGSAAAARSELRLKGTEVPCLTVMRGFTLRLIIGPIVAGGTIQINDENGTALATFKGRPFQTFRGMELMSSDHKPLGHIKIVIKPMSCPGQAISDASGELIGRVEWEGTTTARLSVSEKHAQDVSMKKILFGVFFGCQMLRAW